MRISVSRNAIEIGEYPASHIAIFLNSGILAEDDYVWFEGMDSWEKIDECKVIQEALDHVNGSKTNWLGVAALVIVCASLVVIALMLLKG